MQPRAPSSTLLAHPSKEGRRGREKVRPRTVTTWPWLRSSIPGRKARTIQKCARMLTSKVRMISPSLASSSFLPDTTPALLMRMSTRPTSRAKSAMAVRLVTSSFQTRTRAPRWLTSVPTLFTATSSRSQSTRLAPCFANSSARSRPMPLPAPVISTTSSLTDFSFRRAYTSRTASSPPTATAAFTHVGVFFHVDSNGSIPRAGCARACQRSAQENTGNSNPPAAHSLARDHACVAAHAPPSPRAAAHALRTSAPNASGTARGWIAGSRGRGAGPRARPRRRSLRQPSFPAPGRFQRRWLANHAVFAPLRRSRGCDLADGFG